MPASKSQRRLVSVPQAAEYAGVCSKTIRRRISDGTISGYRFGPRLIRVDLDEIDAVLRPLATAGGAK
ncbi:helix-turn-helix transcriptional regulator [Rhodococcus aetherivorans]|uniref:helix-turn-helix transcriptional regulator n=1 Tax=Rhodococcus aetherivorans TaxID=191292 RepID=UPI002949F93B|nr:helix-turn-helix domain-containing protein [Rhodococcus aetherivorans]MDV6291495.1 helix-turn-helix domain-containing protein [Rhodococcus aetherivorans]